MPVTAGVATCREAEPTRVRKPVESARVIVIANPPGDGMFRGTAQAHAKDGANTPQELQRRLREHWPRARVVGGITDRGSERWYAYREGSWIER